jgi:teichoic acid transport system ATP-binding protein
VSTRPDPLAIRVKNVDVEYEVLEERRAALVKRLTTREGTGRSVIHAVKDMSFDVHQGESIGIVGSNGSGKSSLLLALAGVLPLASGEILVNEEPKLMAVGAQLIPSATGRRNIRIGCLAQGVAFEEIDERVDEIIDFIEMREAIDRPFRTYSSGMRARISFAIATAVQPRVLLIDEALAVGDRHFIDKSMNKVSSMLRDAGVLLLVSHSMAMIADFCTRGIWIDAGVMMADGPVDEVIDAYNAS